MTCDCVKIAEIDADVRKIALGKSPGHDGLTTHFSGLFEAMKEFINNNNTPLKMNLIYTKPKRGQKNNYWKPEADHTFMWVLKSLLIL